MVFLLIRRTYANHSVVSHHLSAVRTLTPTCGWIFEYIQFFYSYETDSILLRFLCDFSSLARSFASLHIDWSSRELSKKNRFPKVLTGSLFTPTKVTTLDAILEMRVQISKKRVVMSDRSVMKLTRFRFNWLICHIFSVHRETHPITHFLFFSSFARAVCAFL